MTFVWMVSTGREAYRSCDLEGLEEHVLAWLAQPPLLVYGGRGGAAVLPVVGLSLGSLMAAA